MGRNFERDAAAGVSLRPRVSSAPASSRIAGPIRVLDPVAPRQAKIVSRPGRLALQLLGVAAVGASVLVNIVDPYSGVAASEYFTVALEPGSNLPSQTVTSSSLAASIVRDGSPSPRRPSPRPPPPRRPPDRVVGRRPREGDLRRVCTARRCARSGQRAGHSRADGGRPRVAGNRIRLPRTPCGRANRTGIQRLQRQQRCIRHPAVAARQQDGDRRRRLGDQPGDADHLGLGYIAGRYETPCGAWAHSGAQAGTSRLGIRRGDSLNMLAPWGWL